MTDLYRIVRDSDEWTPPRVDELTFQLSVLTWIERDGGSADPWALARAIVPELAELAQADRIFAEVWTRERRGLLMRYQEQLAHRRDWGELMAQGDVELEERGEFPDRITFEREGRLVLAVRTQFWNLVGGPAPYHDSVSLAVYAERDMAAPIEAIVNDRCASLGIELLQIER